MYHRCTVEILYNYDSFCCFEYNYEKKIIGQGVTKKGMPGIPTYFLQ